MLFFNLTNGLEAIEKYPNKVTTLPHFVRIQSTWCEQKRWQEIIMDLDYTFLMACRTAKEVHVIDFSAKKRVPRALYQGLSWIQYCLNRYWYGIKDEPALVKQFNCTAYFEKEYEKLLYDKSAEAMFNKLKYFKKFTGTGKVIIHGIAGKTEHDGDYEYYNNIIKSWNIE